NGIGKRFGEIQFTRPCFVRWHVVEQGIVRQRRRQGGEGNFGGGRRRRLERRYGLNAFAELPPQSKQQLRLVRCPLARLEHPEVHVKRPPEQCEQRGGQQRGYENFEQRKGGAARISDPRMRERRLPHVRASDRFASYAHRPIQCMCR